MRGRFMVGFSLRIVRVGVSLCRSCPAGGGGDTVGGRKRESKEK